MKKKTQDDNSFFTNKTLKAALFGAILSFMVAKICNPILEKIYAIFLTLGGTFVQKISNRTYESISCGYSEQISGTILYIVMILSSSLLFYVYFKIKEQYDNLMFRIEKTKRSINNLDINESYRMSESKIDDEISTQKAKHENLKTEANELHEECRYKAKRTMWIMRYALLFSIIILISMYTKNIFVVNKITVMTNNIEIVSPYISDMEYKQLKSKFYTIKNSDDYNSLSEILTNIAKYNSIEIKK